MSLRSAKERLFQTLAFEFGGVVLATPVYKVVFDQPTSQSLLLLIALSAIVMIWSPFHNTAFDRLDLHLTGKVASERSHRWRMVHATSHEVTVSAATLPVVVWLGGHDLPEALMINVGLTLFYAAYTYIFHIVFDWLRPVR